MTKTTVTVRGKRYELELHGVIHVSLGGRYHGDIEFDGGFGPVTRQHQESAKTNSVLYLDDQNNNEDYLPAETIDSIHSAIERIMPVQEGTE